ncbi:MAG: MFS transporter [Burkholderiales bacterium]|nr:MFS transporter [Burkholderiales bacterium]
MSAAASLPAPRHGALREDVRTIGLIGLAHGTSHFFHLLLPPLFPWFIRDFGYSYAELGLLVSVFFAVSGIGQALAGFVVDRIGARPVLFAALGCFVAAALAVASASGYASLMAAAALAGLGNAPFHPVDFTILNRRISPARLGHAYSVHGISGNLGWAAAPLFLAGLTAATGSWRLAAAGAGLWALLVLALLVHQRQSVADRVAGSTQVAAHAAAGAPAGEHPLAFLRLPSVWLCFSFFFWSTAALSAIQSFAGPALQRLHGISPAAASFVVSGYMLCGAAGMIVGGFLVARVARLERIISACLLAASGVLVAIGLGWLPQQGSVMALGLSAGTWAVALTALAGIGAGLAGPSRDMLIKQAAPPGATGRVYGTVYSGLDLGFALSAPVFGLLLDRGQPAAVYLGAAACLAAGVACAAGVGTGVAARKQALAAT